MGAMKEILNDRIAQANRRAQHTSFADWVEAELMPRDLADYNQRPPLDAVQVGDDWYTLAQLNQAWADYIDDALPPIGAAPTRRAYRITYHENGRLISMSPGLETIGDIAVAIHLQRSLNPMPGEYRVWRIAQGGASARLIGNPQAYYPLTPLADLPPVESLPA